MPKNSYSIAVKNFDGTIRSPVGRYTSEDRWLDANTAHWYAASEQRILRHIGRLMPGAEVVVVAHRDSHAGRLLGLPDDLQWASGDQGLLVGEVRGRRVVAVRRFVGFVAPYLSRTHLSGITAYWTSVIETAPNSGRPMAYISTRHYTDDYTPSDEITQRNRCVAQARLRIHIDNNPPEDSDG